MLHPVLPNFTWPALRHHPRLISNAVGVLGAPVSAINAMIFSCSSHRMRGVVSIYFTSPAGIVSTIGFSTSTFASSCFDVYINPLLLASQKKKVSRTMSFTTFAVVQFQTASSSRIDIGFTLLILSSTKPMIFPWYSTGLNGSPQTALLNAQVGCRHFLLY